MRKIAEEEEEEADVRLCGWSVSHVHVIMASSRSDSVLLFKHVLLLRQMRSPVPAVRTSVNVRKGIPQLHKKQVGLRLHLIPGLSYSPTPNHLAAWLWSLICAQDSELTSGIASSKA
jgi:hypothetical protein